MRVGARVGRMSNGPAHPREPWLTRKELAAALKVHPRTIARLGIKPDLMVGHQGPILAVVGRGTVASG